MQADSHRIIHLYIQNEGAKQTEQNTVGSVTLETKFSESTETSQQCWFTCCTVVTALVKIRLLIKGRGRDETNDLIPACKSIRSYVSNLLGYPAEEKWQGHKHILQTFIEQLLLPVPGMQLQNKQKRWVPFSFLRAWADEINKKIITNNCIVLDTMNNNRAEESPGAHSRVATAVGAGLCHEAEVWGWWGSKRESSRTQ